MAISFDTAQGYGASGSGSPTRTCSFTVGTGSNRLLVVAIYSSALSGLTYNGVAMTKIGHSFFESLELWYLLDPDEGTHDMVATSSGNFAFNPSIYIGSYFGVEDIDNSVTQEDGGTNSATITLTTVADNCWLIMAGFADNGGPVGAGADTVVRATNNGYGGLLDSNSVKTPAGSDSLNYTGNGHMYGVMASFSPASDPPADTSKFFSVM